MVAFRLCQETRGGPRGGATFSSLLPWARGEHAISDRPSPKPSSKNGSWHLGSNLALVGSGMFQKGPVLLGGSGTFMKRRCFPFTVGVSSRNAGFLVLSFSGSCHEWSSLLCL